MKHMQAFPMPYNGHDGMTLRDYFAAKAMQVLIAATISADSELVEEDAALVSYRMADAMIKERDE
jgi:predicted lipid-binding transport protein (Tim44 family)